MPLNMDRPTDFHRSRSELEEFLMAAVCVAGKSAHVQAARLHRFLYEVDDHVAVKVARTPFDRVRAMVEGRRLFRNLVAVGMGKYQLITASFRAMALADPPLDLWEAPWQRLTDIPGIRPKTAKFFVLHSREGARVAVLDTHMWKKVKAAGYSPPPFPPPDRLEYAFWEAIVLGLADRAGMAPAEFDLAAWLEFRRPPSGPRSPPGPPSRPGGRRPRAGPSRPRSPRR